jgi:hypothetical protein
MARSGLNTWEEVRNAKRPIRMGGVRTGTSYTDVPKILNQVAGTSFDVISGYAGTSPVRMALQRHEVEGACLGWESMRVSNRAMLDAKGDDRLIPFITHKRMEDPEVQDLPLFTEVIQGKTWLHTKPGRLPTNSSGRSPSPLKLRASACKFCARLSPPPCEIPRFSRRRRR